ncbi:MAG: hypothetical protein HOO98_13410 [Nitrospira sp.]|nr:hypothetical protein [Nitrospira sp.]
MQHFLQFSEGGIAHHRTTYPTRTALRVCAVGWSGDQLGHHKIGIKDDTHGRDAGENLLFRTLRPVADAAHRRTTLSSL